jgi:hypothetical protein
MELNQGPQYYTTITYHYTITLFVLTSIVEALFMFLCGQLIVIL